MACMVHAPGTVIDLAQLSQDQRGEQQGGCRSARLLLMMLPASAGPIPAGPGCLGSVFGGGRSGGDGDGVVIDALVQ